jgi:glutamate/tyrosine decarboxylase-like PLP-dependent enzyme
MNDATAMPRQAPLDLPPEEFRRLGHALVDRIADFLARLPELPVTRGERAADLRKLLPQGALPTSGSPADPLLTEAAQLLFDHSLFNGHPRFWGYITSSAAPLGALADMLAAAVNPNVGSFDLSPIATEIERQTVRWIAELIGFPSDSGGVLVSGGNMANFVCVLAARRTMLPWNAREQGVVGADGRTARIYASTATHTWIDKAVDLFGFGAGALAKIATQKDERIDVAALEKQIALDRAAGRVPIMVVATAGTVSTGAVDPIAALADLCAREKLWLHVDGAYGGFAARAPSAPSDLTALTRADSVAIDPHKWLYVPLEAGCALVKNATQLRDAFSFRPPYYRFEDEGAQFYELGMQNSRGFRALKVWLGLRQAGEQGCLRMIEDDMALSRKLRAEVEKHADLQPMTQALSICTFRYAPHDLKRGDPAVETYLSQLNERVLGELQAGGEAYVSNAVLGGAYVLRACIVNFRTTDTDVAALPAIVMRLGKKLDTELRPAALRS